MLWAYLLNDEGPGDLRALLTEQHGTSMPDELWDDTRGHLVCRISDLLRALDARGGRDALAAWETAWNAEREGRAVLLTDAAGADGLISLGEAARSLVCQGRHFDLLDAYTRRHPNPTTWIVDSPDHHACANAVGWALTERGQDRMAARDWGEALADFSLAARLGSTLGSAGQAAVLRAEAKMGRGPHGNGCPSTRIDSLELAYSLLPEDGPLAAELTAELVRQGQRLFDSDSRQSRTLVVSPQDNDARCGLDDHVRADLLRLLNGTHPLEKVRTGAVLGLLQRNPEHAPAAREWLRRHYAEQAVTAASGGRQQRRGPPYSA